MLGERGEQRRVVGERSQSPEQEEGDTGNTIQETAETRGALARLPASVPRGGPVCLPLVHQAPGPNPWSSEGGAVPANGLCDGCLALQHRPAGLMVR